MGLQNIHGISWQLRDPEHYGKVVLVLSSSSNVHVLGKLSTEIGFCWEYLIVIVKLTL